ncbi:MAG: RluA family pseudouridine synthase [Bacteroidota bacterium]
MADAPRFAGRISDWILHKDNQLIAFNKPAGLSVQPDKTGDPSLLGLGAAYVRHDLYLIHRLDRPVSGVVLLGQKPSAQTALTRQLQKGAVEKHYLAIVANRPEKDEDTLIHYLKNARGNRSAIDENPSPGSKTAELYYRYLGSSERYHLLAIQLKTGRKHQIRVHLASIGCPLRGDTKYGFKRANTDGSIDLHSYRIAYDHPVSGERVEHTAPLPDTPVWTAFKDLL